MNVAIIPARAGSKGLINKNKFLLNDKPLICYTVEAALSSSCIESVVVTTDIPDIEEILSKYPRVNIIHREKHLCTDTIPLAPVIIDAVKLIESRHWTNISNVFTLQPTSPFRTKDHIEHAYKLYIASKANSLVSVKEEHHSIWKMDNGFATPIRQLTTNRQEVDPYYTANGAIFITNKECLIQANDRICGDVVLYTMSDITSLDIHNIDDMSLAEYYINQGVV